MTKMNRWTPDFRLAVTPANLRLTFHARKRMNQRHLTRDDITLVIRHGKCVHREGKVYYTPDGDNGKKVLFAEVDKKMSLDHDDFYIISL